MSSNNSSNSTDSYPLSIPRDPLLLQITIRFVYGLVFIVGCGGNLLVCVAIARKRRLRTISNYFTFTLAFSDLIIVVFWLPTQLVSYEIGGFWIFGDFLCNLSYSVVPICLTASIGSLVAISWDRFRAIVFPLRPRLTVGAAKWIIGLIWAIAVVTTSPLYFFAGTQDALQYPGKFYCYDIWPLEVYGHIYWLFVFISQYVVPLFLISLFSIITARKLRKNSMPLVDKSNSYAATTAALRIRQSAKITKMLAALVILYAICMLPQHVLYFIPVLGGVIEGKTQDLLYKVLNLFPMANSSFNPIAYGTLNKEFKAVFKSFFACRFYEDERTVVGGTSAAYNGQRLSTFKGLEYRKVKTDHTKQKKKLKSKSKYEGASSSSSESSHELNSCRVFKRNDKTNSTRALVDNGVTHKSILKNTRYNPKAGRLDGKITKSLEFLPETSNKKNEYSEIESIYNSPPGTPTVNQTSVSDGINTSEQEQLETASEKMKLTHIWEKKINEEKPGDCVTETTV